jgi:glycosyltransferase involved in cell wall biosynthesis
VTDTALVVPCYNEARRLPVERFLDFLRKTPELSLLFVDDGSTDGTRERLSEIARALPERAQVLGLPRNRGKAEAVRAGLLRALALDPVYLGYWDADLATPLGALLELRALLEARPELELVMGARVVLLGRAIERRAPRHYVGRAAATAISLALGLRVYDTQCGAKLFRVTPALPGLLAEPFVARWIFDVEILARMIGLHGSPQRAARALCEHPLASWSDVAGSKLRPADYPRAALDLWRIRRRWLRRPAGAPARAR